MTSEIETIRSRLRDAGATEDELAAAEDLPDLFRLSGVLGLFPPGERITLTEVADRSGLEIGQVVRLLSVAGIAADDLTVPTWSPRDVEWLQSAVVAGEVFGDGAVLALLRRAGVAMSQLANAAGAAFRVNVIAGAAQGALPAMEVIDRNLETQSLVDTFVGLMSQLFRHHTLLSFRDESVAVGRYGELRSMAVGFVDLTSSTQLAGSIDGVELASLIVDFDAAASDAATRWGARVVKTIGDEVMLASADPNAVVRAARDLVEFCRLHDVFIAARGGVVAGDVLEQDGDCYGPVVNLAARFVEAAPDGSVMADAGVVARLAPDLVAEARDPVEHRGIGTVDWYEVVAASG